MKILLQLKQTFRRLMRAPGFVAVAVITMAMGIGASTAVFSVLQTLFLKPLPFTAPERLVRLHTADPHRRFPGTRLLPLSAPCYRDLRERQRVFTDVAAFQGTSYILTGPGDAERVKGLRVTGSFFQVLGSLPALGRTLQPMDEGGPRSVVMTNALWRERYGGDASILGRSVVLNGKGHVVVGILPPAFAWQGGPQVFVPDPPRPDELAGPRGTLAFGGIARLKPGVSVDQASRSIEHLGQELQAEFPDAKEWGIGTTGLWESFYGDRRTTMGFLLLTGLFVLVIACANLANLMLSRAISRKRDMALRMALGGDWRGALQPFLADGFVLSLGGAAMGLVLAWGLSGFLRAYLPLERQEGYGMDLGVLVFTLLAACLTTLVAGVVPALLFPKLNLAQNLREGDKGAVGQSAWFRNGLVAAQVALTLALLVSFSALWQSLRKLQQVPMGFQPDQALAFTVRPNEEKYPSDALQSALCRRIIQGIAPLPGVKAVGSISDTPMGGGQTGDFAVPGRELGNLSAHYRGVSPGGFEALGMVLLQGRRFQERDCVERPPCVIVSRSLARRCWPGEDPLGKSIFKRMYDEKGTSFQVVGVVEDVRHGGPAAARDLETIYWPAFGVSWGESVRIVVRAEQPMTLIPALRATLKGIDPDLPLTGIQTLRSVLDTSLEASRTQASLIGLLAGLALSLAAAGIYGVMAFSVTQRTREIGIRKALGGQNWQVVWEIARRSLALTALGLGVGVLLTVALGTVLASQSYGVSATDPLSIALAGLLLGLVALVAAVLPASRAARMNPADVLRSE